MRQIYAAAAFAAFMLATPAAAATTVVSTSEPGWKWTGPNRTSGNAVVVNPLPPSAGNTGGTVGAAAITTSRPSGIVRVPGDYIFSKSFSVSPGSNFQFLTATWLADNFISSIKLNNIQLTLSPTNLGSSTPANGNQFGNNVGPFQQVFRLSDFGASLKDGKNTISVVLNQRDLGAPGRPGDANNHAYFAMNVTGSVPEPGTWMLMILGLGAVGFAMRRRQKSAVRLQFA